ncbi:MAG: hypothetical protein AAB834_00945 [Patescibacteria group bacterium]
MSIGAVRQIIVITDKADTHLPYVQDHLDVPLTIIDPQELLRRGELTFSIEKGKVIVVHNGVRLDNVTGVWYRKPYYIAAADIPVAAPYKSYSQSNMRAHMDLLLSAFRRAVWISDYYAICRAENKIYQLQLATRLGFNVPRTLMTSNASAALDFITAEDNCIVKAHLSYAGQDSGKTFFATKINRQSPPDLAFLHLAPAIFQQAIDTQFDVRVTVVGDRVFPAIIRNNTSSYADARDWRIGHFEGGLSIEAYDSFPAHMASLCVQHVKRLRLRYGAIDLVMDKQGDFWFLENNPNGQWGFIEINTGHRIGEAIASMLAKDNKNSR